MTREEATVQISLVLGGTMSPSEVDDFLSLNDDDRALVIQTYANAGVVTRDVWADVVEVVKKCADLVAIVLPMVGAIEAAFAPKAP